MLLFPFSIFYLKDRNTLLSTGRIHFVFLAYGRIALHLDSEKRKFSAKRLLVLSPTSDISCVVQRDTCLYRIECDFSFHEQLEISCWGEPILEILDLNTVRHDRIVHFEISEPLFATFQPMLNQIYRIHCIVIV